jgi:hypothetical protein
VRLATAVVAWADGIIMHGPQPSDISPPLEG